MAGYGMYASLQDQANRKALSQALTENEELYRKIRALEIENARLRTLLKQHEDRPSPTKKEGLVIRRRFDLSEPEVQEWQKDSNDSNKLRCEKNYWERIAWHAVSEALRKRFPQFQDCEEYRAWTDTDVAVIHVIAQGMKTEAK